MRLQRHYKLNKEVRDVQVMGRRTKLETQLKLTLRNTLHGTSTFLPADLSRDPHIVPICDMMGACEEPLDCVMLCAAFPDCILVKWQEEVRSVQQWLDRGEIGWIFYKQMGTFMMMYDMFHGPQELVPPTKIPEQPQIVIEVKVQCIYFEYYGRSGVTFYADHMHRPFEPEIKIPYKGVLFQFAKGKGVFVKEVPQEVATILRMEVFSSQSKKYAVNEPEFYATEAEAYAEKNFQYRTLQLDAIVKQCSGRVVAPGDGAGVVLGLAKKYGIECVSTDLYPPETCDPGVKQKSISETIIHLKKTDTLILSYVSFFLTVADWAHIKKKEVKLVIIDTRPILAHLFYEPEYVSWNVISYGVKIQGYMFMVENNDSFSIRFSENLLRSEWEFYTDTIDEGVNYLLALEPTRIWRTSAYFKKVMMQYGLNVLVGDEGVHYNARFEQHVDSLSRGHTSYYYMSGRTESAITIIRDMSQPLLNLESRVTYAFPEYNMPDLPGAKTFVRQLNGVPYRFVNYPYEAEATMEAKGQTQYSFVRIHVHFGVQTRDTPLTVYETPIPGKDSRIVSIVSYDRRMTGKTLKIDGKEQLPPDMLSKMFASFRGMSLPPALVPYLPEHAVKEFKFPLEYYTRPTSWSARDLEGSKVIAGTVHTTPMGPEKPERLAPYYYMRNGLITHETKGSKDVMFMLRINGETVSIHPTIGISHISPTDRHTISSAIFAYFSGRGHEVRDCSWRERAVVT